MTPRVPFRPVLAAGLAILAAGCSAVEADPNRFERWGEAVASIRISADDAPSADRPGAPPLIAPDLSASRRAGLRQALAVEVIEPEQLWDARLGDLRGAMDVAQPVLQQVSNVAEASGRPLAPDTGEGVLIQLGAYSDEGAARAAFAAAVARAGGRLADAQPVLQRTSTVDGRTLVRLKAGPIPAGAAASACRAAGVTDRWCAVARS
ncbi:hypothetical protein Q0812_03325 [Brevundimonas sp. 2R-24]|uniref:SPOR domain-containing protein n=1 Tax=Peiella sedimenti TaxID=3061083 RepID=A0ABT8SMF9_9CAUL|nr:hypothetical protein [Caulobacteraceae bacterium XZ-24]